jgi:glycosyltransferase involved in cell wall biosynthesis
VIISIIYPSSPQRTGGVTMLYEFANAMARRGHEVHFVHGPKNRNLVSSVEMVPFAFDPTVQHHIVDSVDDPRLPKCDVRFGSAPDFLGQPATIVQGFRLIGPVWDAAAYRAANPKICIASWLVDVGRSYGVPEAQLVHIPMGLDHELFAVRNPPVDRTIDVAILYHPNPQKGFAVGRDALAEIVRRRPGVRCVVFSLAGKPLKPLPDGVELVLDLDQRRLADEIYNRTRVMLQASLHEGFGLTAIESMACGAALVTTDCGGSRDYAVPNETAVVVERGDAIGMADAIESLLDDDDRRAALAAEGERYVRKFNWERTAERLEAFLEQYLADPAYYQQPPGEDRSAEYTL